MFKILYGKPRAIRGATLSAGSAFTLCVLALGGCVDTKLLITGEPDRGVPTALLTSVGLLAPSTAADAETTPARCVNTTPGIATNPSVMDCYWSLKSLIDYRYQHYKTNLLHAVNEGGALGDTLTLGLTTAATITPGATAAKLFAALATAATGVKTTITADVLYKQSITLIISEMDSDRTDVQTANAKHAADAARPAANGGAQEPYGWPRAVNDLLAYYEAGTFQHALITLQNKATTPDNTPTDHAQQDTALAAPKPMQVDAQKGAAP